MNGLIGKKIGMTRIFEEDGSQVPVTVLAVGPCVVVQRKTADRDGYDSVQLGFGKRKPQRVSKPLGGHYARAGADPRRLLREFDVESGDGVEVGTIVSVADVFADTQYVDVVASSKGRGYQGVVKRYNTGGGQASHGYGWHRRIGSIGQCTVPSRVHKNRKMPGQMGARRVSVQNLQVVAIREEQQALLVRGAVPGPNGGIVIVKKSLKKAARRKS